jgi:protein involved in polysaccharide export with SLBB domain
VKPNPTSKMGTAVLLTGTGRSSRFAPPGLALAVALVAAAAGCGNGLPYVWANDLPPAETGPDPVIQVRDTIQVDVSNQPTMSGEQLVRDDGHYNQTPVGSLLVAGLTTSDAARIIAMRLKGILQEPRVQVWVTRPAAARVNVVGEVRTPATYELTRDKSVLAALSAAGWLNEFGSKDRIFVVRPGERPLRVRFRLRDLMGQDSASSRFRLREGDTVIVE